MSSDPETAEAGADYDVAGLLHMARLLTSNSTFLITDAASTETLLNLDRGPRCDVSQAELNNNDFFNLTQKLSGQPPTYAGEDPIGNIVMTVRQLASCQRQHGSILNKIGDFFLRRDDGKALRRLLMSTKSVVQALALWYAVQQNGIQVDQAAMQALCRMAIASPDNSGFGTISEDSIPEQMRDAVAQARQWDGNMATVVATFRLGTRNPAPVLLIFNSEALDTVAQATGAAGNLPQQVELSASSSGGGDAPSGSTPVAFMDNQTMAALIRNYVGSGAVKPKLPGT